MTKPMHPDHARFSGKVVVVTGAGTGIGAATVRRFAEEGASLVLCGRNKEQLDTVAATVGDAITLVQPSDVSSLADMDQLARASLERFGRIDVLVNNAGSAAPGPFLDQSPEDWRKVMATGVDGVFFATRAMLPHLLNSHGSIINVSSLSGLGGDSGMSSHSASKGGISNLTRSLALEFGPRGVRVNAVAPGFTLTEATAPMKDDEAMMAKYAERIPLGRGAEAEEIASVIAFLASDDARYVNGVNLPVDGGAHASCGLPNYSFRLAQLIKAGPHAGSAS